MVLGLSAWPSRGAGGEHDGMLDLLDCPMPACHEARTVTTPTAAGVTFAAGLSRGLVAGRADGVELLVRCRLRGHRGYAEEESAK
jgi:hypothetical protein